MGKRDYDYFQTFEELIDYSLKSAEKLNEICRDFNPAMMQQHLQEIHEIEHEADGKKHELRDRLAKEFLPPIEREDIMTLSARIDDVTDSIEDVIQKLYIFNVRTLSNVSVEFSDVIISCCRMLKTVFHDFRNFKKSKDLMPSIIEINRLEEVGDKLYLNAVRHLYTTCNDPVELMRWTEALDGFEECCDCCEHVANAVESVIMKNS